MVDNHPSAIWLAEPAAPDDSEGERGEHTLDWLARSTLPRAAECRRFLNENLAALSLAAQGYMRHELRVRWYSTFFELIVARCLQELGAAILMEPISAESSHRLDCTAQFADTAVLVEAVSPVFNASVGEELKRHAPLLDIVQAHIPEGWHVLVRKLPRLDRASFLVVE